MLRAPVKQWDGKKRISHFFEEMLKILKLPKRKNRWRIQQKTEKNIISSLSIFLSQSKEVKQKEASSLRFRFKSKRKPEDIRNIDFLRAIIHGAMSYVSPLFFMYNFFSLSPLRSPTRKSKHREARVDCGKVECKHIFFHHEEIASFLCTCYVFVVSPLEQGRATLSNKIFAENRINRAFALE